MVFSDEYEQGVCEEKGARNRETETVYAVLL